MAMTIKNEKFVNFSGKMPVAIAEIYIDTSDELPDADGISGIKLHQGSMAYIIRENRLAVMDSTGKWYIDDGEVIL